MTEVITTDIDWYPLASEHGVKARSSTVIKMTYEEPLLTISADNGRGFDFSNQCVDGWIARIRDELYSISSVEDIFISIEDTDVNVWVVIPERNITILRQLVEIEGRILEMLVSGEHPAFLIDFHIIYRCGRNIEELVSNRAIRLPR